MKERWSWHNSLVGERWGVGIRVLGVTTAIAIWAAFDTTGAGASCVTTGSVPTVHYVGTVVTRLDDAGGYSRYVMNVGRGRGQTVELSIARVGSEAFRGPLPKVGHRYDAQGLPYEAIIGREGLSLSACAASSLVDLRGGQSPSGGDRGPLVAVAGLLLGLGLASFVGFRRRRAHRLT